MFLAKRLKDIPQGLKAHIDLIGLMPGINPRRTVRTSFSAAC